MPSRPIGQRRAALRILGLQDPVEPAEVIRAYRRLVRQHHPDLGGDAETFRSLTVARDALLAGEDPDEGAGNPGGRSVRARQRPSRRLLRGLRRRLSRTDDEPRHLE